MKKISLLSCCVMGVLAAALSAGAATLDGLAAKVNDDVITVDEVAAEMRRSGALKPGMDFNVAYSNAVQTAIDRRLILRMAAERKLDMQEWVVDNRIREIVKDNFGGDMNKLTASLAQSRVPLNEWRNQIRDELIIQAMRYQLVDKGLEPTPAAMQQEYQNHSERYHAKASTSVNVILIRPPVSTNAPSVEVRAREIFDRLAKGEKFTDLARQFSADSHAKDGGLWKNIRPEEAFRPEIAAAIGKLNIKQVSPLLNLDGWGFIVQKVDETKDQTRSFAEAYDDIVANLKQDEAEAKYKAWVQRLRADAFIKVFPPPTDR